MRPANDASAVRSSNYKSQAPWVGVDSSHPLCAHVPPHRTVGSCPIQILVADNQPLVREGLRALLSSQPDFLVLGEVHDEATASTRLRDMTPDILLLDSSMLGSFGFDMGQVSAGGESRVCRTIVLTAAIEKENIVQLLRHGARGILSKQSSIELIFKCIRTVHEGEVWVGRNMMTSIVEALSSPICHELRATPGAFRLTRREREVLELVVQSDTNKGIAERLQVSEDTVKHHLTNIFDKTGASNRLELALFALHHHLVAVA